MHHRPRVAIAGTAACVALSIAFAPWATADIVDPQISDSAADAELALAPIGTHETGVFDESAAEIVAHHPATQRLFVVNAQAATIDVLDANDPTAPTKLFSITVPGVTAADGSVIPEGASANSVAVRPDGLVAVAVENAPKTEDGWVVFYDAAGDGSTALGAVRVGALPDMLTFSPDGRKVLVANEGEPANEVYTKDGVKYYAADPAGTVSVIDVPGTVAAPGQDAVVGVGFDAFTTANLPDGVRISGPTAEGVTNPVPTNLEPEYIAVAEDSATAWVALQENNAIARIDLGSNTVTDIFALGRIDRREVPADLSDRDDAINITTVDVPLFSLRMPDAIAAYTAADGQTYLVTANEGDAREWGDDESDDTFFIDEVRVKDLGSDGYAPLCADVFGDVAALQSDEQLGRLKVTVDAEMGTDEDGNPCYAELQAYGGRSFSIFTGDGRLVYDSGSDFEDITARVIPDYFNSNHDESEFDSRSDDKGVEPEAVTIGQVGDRTYAFIGFERIGGIAVYDITAPTAPVHVTYVNNRDFSVSGADTLVGAGDLGPEGIAFIAADDSPTGQPLLAVGNEVSGTTTVWSVTDLVTLPAGDTPVDGDDGDDDTPDDPPAPAPDAQPKKPAAMPATGC